MHFFVMELSNLDVLYIIRFRIKFSTKLLYKCVTLLLSLSGKSKFSFFP